MAEKNRKPRPEAAGRISRREFAGRAAKGAAAALVVPAGLFAPSAVAGPTSPPAQTAAEAPKLSPEARAEAEEKISAIFRKYGARLSEEQKADIRRIMLENQQSLETLRAYPLENSDEPATVLRLERRASAPGSPARRPKSPAPAAKKRG